MKASLLFCLAAASIVTGCAAPGPLFVQREKELTPVEQANAYVPLANPVPSDFCQRVGFDAQQQALHAGFDLSTQDRLATQSAHQCEVFMTMQVAGL